MKKRFCAIGFFLIGTILFCCTSCATMPTKPKDWQTVCIETWDYDIQEKLGGYLRIPPDWEVRTVIGTRILEERYSNPSARFEYFISKDTGQVVMAQTDLMSDADYEYKGGNVDILDEFKKHTISWRCPEPIEEEYEHLVDGVYYGRTSLAVDGTRCTRFYIDINDKRYIVWDDSVPEGTVQTIASSFRSTFMLGLSE